MWDIIIKKIETIQPSDVSLIPLPLEGANSSFAKPEDEFGVGFQGKVLS